ncbi:MAG TPA: hypothetical protein VI410_07930 [Anaerolineales bacterium]|nr:hypothetical protein [Anaerolineales bacterium]
MKHSTLHTLVLVTGLITAFVHLVMLGLLPEQKDIWFILNGLGYLGLLGLFFVNPGIVASRRSLMHYAFIAFAAVTIGAWVAIAPERNALGYFTKLDELVLIAALVAHLRSPSDMPAASGGQS